VYSASTLNATAAKEVDPSTFQEAVSGPEQLEWWAAIQKEYASLLEHGTWEKVRREDVPARDCVIGCKWVFKTKANGTRKARLVIKGYRQKHGIDYHETFAAVFRMDSVRCIVASAVLRGWKLHQFDAVTAFLHGDVDSSIYMDLPEGFEEPGYVSAPTLLVWPQAGPADLVPMRPPRPGCPRLHHDAIRQLRLL
jgi:hypothetical protein